MPGPRDARERAFSYLTDGKLTVAYVDGGYVAAICQAEGQVLNLGYEAERGWWCSCSEPKDCAHLLALKLVTEGAITAPRTAGLEPPSEWRTEAAAGAAATAASAVVSEDTGSVPPPTPVPTEPESGEAAPDRSPAESPVEEPAQPPVQEPVEPPAATPAAPAETPPVAEASAADRRRRRLVPLIATLMLVVAGIVLLITRPFGSKHPVSSGPPPSTATVPSQPSSAPPSTPPTSPAPAPSPTPSLTTLSATFPNAVAAGKLAWGVTDLPPHDSDCLTHAFADHAAYQTACRSWVRAGAPKTYWFYVFVANGNSTPFTLSRNNFRLLGNDGRTFRPIYLGWMSSDPQDFVPRSLTVKPHGSAAGWLTFHSRTGFVPTSLSYQPDTTLVTVMTFHGRHHTLSRS